MCVCESVLEREFMAPEPEKFFQIDGKRYSTQGMSPEGLQLVTLVRFTSKRIRDLSNQHALLMKAKNAYIADLKLEIVQGRTGVDLGALFRF